MAQRTLEAPLGELRRASAAGGTALSTTAAFIALPPGTQWMSLSPRNFATAVVAQFTTNPWLTILKTQDSGATFTDYSDEAQDADTGTSAVLSSQDTAANGDFLYVGSHVQFRGVTIDVDATNSTASVLTVKAWNGSAWADLSATDGTIVTGASLGQDGTVSWTVPSDWEATSLLDAGDTSLTAGIYKTPLYWTRWEWSAALDSTVTLDQMLAMNRSTNYAELEEANTFAQSVTVGPFGISCVEAKTDAGTANLIVNVATLGNGKFS